MVIKELEFLVKGIMRSPKSYTLWFHRQWIIERGLIIEQQLIPQVEGTPNIEWRSRILETELKLCDKMLGMDERNFHCWNYRLLTALLYLKEISSRLEDPEASRLAQLGFLRKECEMAEKLIRKNFSNYSAWHYRSKLLPELYRLLPEESDSTYPIPFAKIQEDLALLKHAFFTDPKD
jgi:geranylgeranyl transferase type-2 subunit alpha